MEAASEKRRRGRPRAFSPESVAAFRNLWPEIRSQRGIQEKIYATLGLAAIEDHFVEHPELKWLFDEAAHVHRQSVLAELGRFPEDLRLEVALELCSGNPPRTTKGGVAILRAARSALMGSTI